MARKQTSGRLNRFLDLIGLVDSDRDDDMEQASVRTTRGRNTRRSGADEFDEFDEFDDPMPARQRRMPTTTRRGSRVNVEGDEFDDEQAWASGAASRGGRTRAAASESSRGTASQRGGARSGYRASSASGGAAGYERRTAAAASSGYRASEAQSRYRGSASSGYSAASRRDVSGYDAPPAASSAYQRHQTVIFMLHSVDECKEVILSLIDKKSVLLNLDELDAVQAQRALDTMSGATYAIGATLSRASDRTYLITPSNVEVERSSMDADGYN